MPGLIINEAEVDVEGIKIVNFKDDSRLKLDPNKDMRLRRTMYINCIVLHNTKNVKTAVKLGTGPGTDLPHRIANLWSTDARNAGAHLSVDWDGTVCCHADLLLNAAYHAGSINEVSIGCEIYEDASGIVYQKQLETICDLTIWLCRKFGIQTQMPLITKPDTISRIVIGGNDCIGVFGHCHQNRFKNNDPGKSVFEMLATKGFKQFDFEAREDFKFWKPVQRGLGIIADGIPGKATCKALLVRGYQFGLHDFKK